MVTQSLWVKKTNITNLWNFKGDVSQPRLDCLGFVAVSVP
jgi:hypothetical protein